jgi:hypothetical protein
LRHVLEDGREESDLYRCRMLEERVQRCGPFGLGQHSEPWSLALRLLSFVGPTLLNSTKLFGKILIGRSSSHLFKSLLPVGKVLEPLVDLLGCLSAAVQKLEKDKAYSLGSWT